MNNYLIDVRAFYPRWKKISHEFLFKKLYVFGKTKIRFFLLLFLVVFYWKKFSINFFFDISEKKLLSKSIESNDFSKLKRILMRRFPFFYIFNYYKIEKIFLDLKKINNFKEIGFENFFQIENLKKEFPILKDIIFK